MVRPELGPCWVWQRRVDKGGYGTLNVKRRPMRAHRLAWELERGSVPLGDDGRPLCVCHACDNPPCCNPQHLFVGTTIDNNADRVAKGRCRYEEPRNRARGERVGNAELNEAIVKAMSAEYEGGATQAQLGTKYHVRQTTVSAVLRGLVWAHVPRKLFATGRGGYASNGQHQRRRANKVTNAKPSSANKHNAKE